MSASLRLLGVVTERGYDRISGAPWYALSIYDRQDRPAISAINVRPGGRAPNLGQRMTITIEPE